MKTGLRLLLRPVCTCALAYFVLAMSAIYADRSPRFAEAVGGHNIVLQIVVTFPVFYFALGLLPILRKPAANPRS